MSRMHSSRALGGTVGPGWPDRDGRWSVAGFSRVELAMVVLVLMVLGTVVWLGKDRAREARNTWACKQRLKGLGEAFAMYARERAGRLPVGAAQIPGQETSWDRELAGMWGVSGAVAALEREAGRFWCPSDREPRGEGRPRSYAMPMYELRTEGWPPGRLSRGGVGLYLDPGRLRIAWESDGTLGETWPVMRISMVPDPSGTALLVERVAIRNVLGSPTFACILNTREQWAAKTLERDRFHGGRFNYLMVDGHVERMTERVSGGHTGDGGVWTLRPDD